MIKLKSTNLESWFPLGTDNFFERNFKDYFRWQGLSEEYVAYRDGLDLRRIEVFCDKQLMAQILKPYHWVYRGHEVKFKFSKTPIYRKTWQCVAFGKLTILYYSGFYSVYLNGNMVGKYRSLKNPICDFIYRRNYIRRCRKKNVVPIEKPSDCLIELDDDKIDPLLALLLVIHIYMDDIEID